MSKYGKAVMFKVSDQQLAGSQNCSESANNLAETLLKKQKFLYIDMEDGNFQRFTQKLGLA